ncbi:MAG: DUF2306 domain-containing protein [Bacteroidota bacterium]
MQKALRSISIGITGCLAIGVSLYAFSYLLVEHGFLQTKTNLNNFQAWNIIFHFHFIGGGIALFLGWAQFWKWLRNKYFRFHRITGMIYVGAILLASAPAGIYASFFAIGRFSNDIGFGMMGVLWFIFTFLAFTAIKKKNLSEHINWMIRSYALTLGAVTLRLWLPILMGLIGLSFDEAYSTVAWLSWVPNLIVAEIVIAKGWIEA